MAKKPTVTTLASGFNSTETLNANFEALRDGFDNTLSLDGSTPNAMGGDLDLNSNNIINATAIMVGGSDVVATTAAALAAAVQAQIDADAAVVASALSETNAANSATASQTSADASQASRLASELAETNAETAETNAETAETNSQTSATNSAASANAALGSETAASGSAAAALASQVAANTSQGNASVSALAASNSETAAALSETNAATSETNAATSETNAATSETNAANSETAAAASETAAATSETNAATSETNAAASAVTATTGATTATAQAIIATDQAAQAAADVASIAGAAGSAVEAANSAAAAAAALDNFDDRYLGPKSSEPTLDNDGDALVSGSLYFSTTSNAMQVYDGANWIAASASGVASMILYEYTATAGQTTFTGADDNNNSISFIQGNEIVVFNGIILDPSDYTSTSGVSIVLNVGASVGDLLNVYAFKSFTVADTVSASTGGTFGGDVTVTGTLAATTLTGDGSAITGLPAGYTNTDVATYLAGVGNVVVGGTVDGRDLAIDGAVIDGLSTVATSGSFNDLSDQPAPFDPTTLAPVATSGVYSDLTGTPTLAAVATTGAYSSLSGLPTLGTAASTSSSAYATAAQGTKADTALQPALAGVTSVDATTVAAFAAAGVGAPFKPTTVSGSSPSLNVGSNNYFQQGALTANTTVSFASVPTNANWRYSFQQAIVANPYDISKSVLDNDPYNTSFDGIGTARQGIYITPTGHKLFLGGYNGNEVNEYDLTTPFDAGTMTFVRTKSVNGTGTMMSVFFKPDGTEMYLCGYGPNHWAQWTLSTAWNISTATLTRTTGTSSGPEPTGLIFKPDGTRGI